MGGNTDGESSRRPGYETPSYGQRDAAATENPPQKVTIQLLRYTENVAIRTLRWRMIRIEIFLGKSLFHPYLCRFLLIQNHDFC